MNQQPPDEPDSERLLELFARVSDLPIVEREEFLNRECADRPLERKRIAELLHADAAAGRFMAGAPEAPALTDPAAASPTQSQESDASAKLGTIGRYKLLQVIGEGGFGTVYMAEQVEPIRRRVALKLIKLGMDTRAVIARFDAERQALAMMDHQNIARVFDAGATENGRPYFVMELVNGVPLTQYCDDNRLTPHERLELFIPICQAVQHAHQKGIIHRDLKPSNVLITLHDGAPVPKVIDFGIAKATQARLTERTMFTELRQMIGTPQYMSPEQAEMSGLDIDTRSDIYSLGVMLYELLTGTTPLDATEMRRQAYAEMQRLIREVEPPLPSARVSTLAKTGSAVAQHRRTVFRQLQSMIKGDLDWVVMKCLEKNRSHRYDTAATLAADISRYLLHEPVSAAKPSNLYRLRKYFRRHRVQVVVILIVAISLIGGAAASTYGLVREARQRKIADTEHAEADRQRIQADQSRVQAQQAEQRAEQHETVTREINGFLTQMLTAADPEHTLGEKVTVVQAVTAAGEALDHGGLANEPLVEASARLTIGETLRSLGRYDLAEHQLQIALDLQRKYGASSDDQDLALAANDLGTLLSDEGRLSAAEPLLKEALAIDQKILPANHPDIARTISNLALVLKDQGKLADAEPLLRDALAISRKVQPPDLANIAKGLINLADLLYDQGKYAECESTIREALDEQRKALPAGDPLISTTLGVLANTLEKQSNPKEAESLRREALAISRKALPAGHPDIGRDLYCLAQSLNTEGKPEEAEPLYREAFSIISNALPPGDPHANMILAQLVNTLQKQHKLSEAESFCRQGLATDRKALAPGDPQLLADLERLGIILLQEKKSEESAGLFQEAAAAHRAASPVDEVVLANDLWGVGRSLWRVPGKSSDAEAALRESLSLFKTHLGNANPETRKSAGALADLLNSTGRNDQAAALRLEFGLPPSTQPTSAPAKT